MGVAEAAEAAEAAAAAAAAAAAGKSTIDGESSNSTELLHAANT